MTYHVSMIGELPNPSEKQIFQKHVDGEKNRSYSIFSMTSTEKSPLKNNSNQISFYFLRHVMHTCVYNCAFAARDMQRYLLVVSVTGGWGGWVGVVAAGFI